MKKQPSALSGQRSAKPKPPRVSVKVGGCSIYFSGLNMAIKCPACGVVVRDGEEHRCENGKPVIDGEL